MTNTTIYTTPACIVCHKTSLITVDVDALRRWKRGELIQHVWPSMTPERREQFISGTHAECWQSLFGEED